jgi:hypothetical protein
MFIRSSTAINDCLIALRVIKALQKENSTLNFIRQGYFIYIIVDGEAPLNYEYKTQEARDKAFDELCEFLNKNYKLRDFL